MQWLELNKVPWALVLTKTDKLKNAALARSRREWQAFLGAESVVEFSAVSGAGRDKLWREIDAALQGTRAVGTRAQ